MSKIDASGMEHGKRGGKKNWDNGALLWNEETALWELCPERLKVADGPRYIPDIWGRLMTLHSYF